jgi:hypothetical protein
MPYNIDIPGWMTITELQDIETLAQMVPEHGTVVEVGSLFGRSSYAFHESMPETAKLYCIDWWGGDDPAWPYTIPPFDTDAPWSPCGMGLNYENFQKYTSDLERIVAIKGKSPYVFDVNGGWQYGTVDLFFLDANHVNPDDWDSIKFWLPLMNAGGIFAGHDHTGEGWEHKFPDVLENIAKLERILDQKVTTFERPEHPSTVWYFKLEQDGWKYDFG